MLGIVNGGIQHEYQFGDYPELLGDLVSELSTYGTDILLQGIHHFPGLGRREDTDENLGHGQVGTDSHLAYRYHGTAESSHTFTADNLRETLLKFAGNLELSCTCRCFHYCTLIMK